jgi:hypothetical protein
MGPICLKPAVNSLPVLRPERRLAVLEHVFSVRARARLRQQ